MTSRDAVLETFANEEDVLTTADVLERLRLRFDPVPWAEGTIRVALMGSSPNHPTSRHYPWLRRKGVLFSLGGGRFRLWNEDKDGSLEAARRKSPPPTAPKRRRRSSAKGVAPSELDRMEMRAALVRRVVDDVHAAPCQPHYRGEPHGPTVAGWTARLASYFWPHPVMDLRATAEVMRPWFNEAGTLSVRLLEGEHWSDEDRRRASVLAWQMLTWGGVTRQKAFSVSTVEAVFRRSLALPWEGEAPMNSGWSKVAALATAFLEGDASRAPHVIWDSRVSTSLIARLEPHLVAEGLAPRRMFPGIGTVPGRGGTRPRATALSWPSSYMRWAGQEAGSALVREIRDVLTEGKHGAMPRPEGDEGPWTIRGVESVLFMDGY